MAAAVAAAEGDAPATSVIGTVAGQPITEAAVVAASGDEFARLQRQQTIEQRQLETKFAQSRHELLQQRLDQMLDRDALEAEATARGVSTDQVLAGLKLDVPTEAEARAFYEANRGRITEPYETVAPKVLQYLTKQRTQSATRRFYDDLRAKHGITANLGPLRIPVAASGPARGNTAAPVTIVEFGDFQCPYCKQAEASLRTIMEHHPQDVRIVFRNLPLARIHPNAQIAAEAGVCANDQGKFWPMHDAMYDDQSRLTAAALRETAQKLGLDSKRFSACLGSDATRDAIAADENAADALGLEGTPYFFINGRPLDGNVPLEQFESVIAEELHSSPQRGG
jgi:protein-disulfide isomerase